MGHGGREVKLENAPVSLKNASWISDYAVPIGELRAGQPLIPPAPPPADLPEPTGEAPSAGEAGERRVPRTLAPPSTRPGPAASGSHSSPHVSAIVVAPRHCLARRIDRMRRPPLKGRGPSHGRPRIHARGGGDRRRSRGI